MIFGSKSDDSALKGQIEKLEKQNRIMRSALEFYADVQNWEEGINIVMKIMQRYLPMDQNLVQLSIREVRPIVRSNHVTLPKKHFLFISPVSGIIYLGQ